MTPTLMALQVLRLTTTVIDKVAQLPQTPTRHELPSILVRTAGEHAGEFKAHAEVRILPHYASAFAATFCWRFNPAPDWTYVGPDLAAAVAALPAGATRSQQQRVFTPGLPRLAWTSPAGAVIIDELHSTHYRDGLLDGWMRERLAADLVLAQAALPTFAGIRLVSLRTPERSLLITTRADLTTPRVLSATALGSVGGWWR